MTFQVIQKLESDNSSLFKQSVIKENLDNEEFKPGTRGLNNRSVGPTIQLDVNQGAVLICIETP